MKETKKKIPYLEPFPASDQKTRLCQKAWVFYFRIWVQTPLFCVHFTQPEPDIVDMWMRCLWKALNELHDKVYYKFRRNYNRFHPTGKKLSGLLGRT